jgi:hypothetical protein
MKIFNILLTISIFVLLVFISCSGRDSRVLPEDFLPESISSLEMNRASDLVTFRGDSLTQYTNDAEYYFRFNFVDMATADYSRDNIVTEVEIFRFASPEDAYGIYSHFRWGKSDMVVPLAIEGFRTSYDAFFVKGQYVAHIMGFDESQIPTKALDDLAAYFADELPGDTTLPDRFGLIPQEGIVPASAMYFPNMFLGLDFMNCVYACSYEIGDDTVFLFMACDSAGPMVLQWSKLAEEDSTYQPLPEGIPYDDGKGFRISHPRYGPIIIGVKNNIMAAILGYEERHRQFLTEWINSLPEKTI